MATVNLGSIKFKWKGTYAGGTAYTIDDVVSYNGSSYICIQASTGNLPTNATYFEQMSSAGTNGTDGTDLTTTLTTQGDMLYRDGSGLQRLAKGTANQELRMNSGATAPEWYTPSGGGFGQVKYASINTPQSIQSSFTDLGLSVNITPTATSSKILVTVGVHGSMEQNEGWSVRIVRGSTTVYEEPSHKANYIYVGGQTVYGRWNSFSQYLDSPNTTSQTNYKVQVYTDGQIDFQQNSNPSFISVQEVS